MYRFEVCVRLALSIIKVKRKFHRLLIRLKARDEYAWEILKIDLDRLVDLHDRSLKKAKANKKPVKFPL